MKLLRNSWNFVVITFGQLNQATCYINNDKSQTITIFFINTKITLVSFGRKHITNKRPNEGFLTDIRMWDRVIDINEITVISKFGNVSDGLIGAWTFYDNKMIDIVSINSGIIIGNNSIVNLCKNGK